MLIAMNRGLNHKATFTCGAYPEAIYYAEAAEIYLEEEEFERAREMALKALALIPEKHADAVKPYCILIKYESIKGRRGKSLEYYD
jgi:tetratricopeptide (TPR) repeat protein